MSTSTVKLNNAVMEEENRLRSVRSESKAAVPPGGEIVLEMDVNHVIGQVIGSGQSHAAVSVRPAFTHFNRTLRLCALLRTPISTTNIVSCDSTFAFFVLAFHWVNVFKFCEVYTESAQNFGPKLFTLILIHLFALQVALSATMFVFPFSRTLPKFIKMWSAYKKKYGGLSVYYIQRVVIVSVVIHWTLTASLYALFCTTGVFYGPKVMPMDIMHRSIMIPFYQDTDVPIYLYALAACIFYMFLFVTAAQLFALVLLCYFLKREFDEITSVLGTEISGKDGCLLNVEHYRQRHNAVAGLVTSLDDMMSGYLAVEYGTNIPILIFTLYCFIYSGDFGNSARVIMVLTAAPSFGVMVWLSLCTGSCTMVHTAAIAPKKILYDLNMRQHQAAGRSLEVQAFLGKLTTEHIGLTACKLFNINRTTVFTISILFLSYMVVLMKFGLSFEGCHVNGSERLNITLRF